MELINGWYRQHNAYPTEDEQQHNILNIIAYFRQKGWSDNAIAGLVGNTYAESHHNPGLFEGRPDQEPADPNTWRRGIGLTQWTSTSAPPQKLVAWAEEWNVDFRDGWAQCFRIYREQTHEYQWIKGNVGGITFTEWSTLTQSPQRMSDIFARAYERAAETDFETREQHALMCWDLMQTEPELPDVPPDPHQPIPIWLLFKFRKRRRF